MEPEPGNPLEVEGVLNPAAVRGPDGQLYLFPRLVAKGNYSRIGIARVKFNEAGDPAGVERLGIALEPEADYELRPDGGGGCEDPRITFVEPLQRYVMTYTALSPKGPRIALAISEDLFHWQRLGLATFRPYRRHRVRRRGQQGRQHLPRRHSRSCRKPADGHPPSAPLSRDSSGGNGLPDRRPAWWISIARASGFPTARWRRLATSPYHLGHFTSHHRLASPVAPWERLKIGGGTPPDPDPARMADHLPRRQRSGASRATAGTQLCYSAGVMVLSEEHPRVIRYRSPEPVLTPELPQERSGTVANVVFPTAIDRRDDLACPTASTSITGWPTTRIGVARLDLRHTTQPAISTVDEVIRRPRSMMNAPAGNYTVIDGADRLPVDASTSSPGNRWRYRRRPASRLEGFAFDVLPRSSRRCADQGCPPHREQRTTEPLDVHRGAADMRASGSMRSMLWKSTILAGVNRSSAPSIQVCRSRRPPDPQRPFPFSDVRSAHGSDHSPRRLRIGNRYPRSPDCGKAAALRGS